MAKFKVEVWHVQSYQMAVDAASAEDAETEAGRLLEELSLAVCGAEYADQWLDVMNAEAA